MAGQGQQQQQQQNQGDDWIWIIVGIALIFSIIWYVKHDWITNVWFRIKWAEASLLGFVLPGAAEQSALLASILSSPKAIHEVSFGDFLRIAKGGMLPWGILTALGLGYLGYRIFMGNPRGKLSRKLNMDGLMDLQQAEFPYILPVSGLDLINDTSKEWAPVMRPESQYDNRGKLVEAGFADVHGIIQSRLFDRNKAMEVFLGQVGRPWPMSYKRLKKYECALFGVFAARIMRDKDSSRAALRQMAINMGPGGNRSFDPGIELAKRYGNEQDVKDVISRHRFVTSVLAALLEDARVEGRLPSSEFIWLKPLDRNLWYLLNAIGRRVPSVEASGSFANFIAEKFAYRSNKRRSDLIAKRAQREAALQVAAERNISISSGDDVHDESDIPEMIVLTGPVVDEAIESLYQYMKEKDLCE